MTTQDELINAVSSHLICRYNGLKLLGVYVSTQSNPG